MFGPELLPRIRSLQLSRHWSLPLPFQYQGHVGFYVRVEPRKAPSGLGDWGWQPNTQPTARLAAWAQQNNILLHQKGYGITIGTYPMAKDYRKARLDSVQLLANAIRGRALAQSSDGTEEGTGLDCEQVCYMVRAMDVVATRPILALHGDAVEAYDEACKMWSAMNEEFCSLS